MNSNLKQKYYEDIVALMPGHVYWKDKNGAFLGCNLEQARDAGFETPEQMIGKTDYDMPWSIQADYLREIDKKVMHSGRTLTIEELYELPDGTKKSTSQISYPSLMITDRYREYSVFLLISQNGKCWKKI